MGFEMNMDGLRELTRNLEEKFAAGINIPLDGSEADAIDSVKEQLEQMGLEPNDAEVERYVRDARNSS